MIAHRAMSEVGKRGSMKKNGWMKVSIALVEPLLERTVIRTSILLLLTGLLLTSIVSANVRFITPEEANNTENLIEVESRLPSVAVSPPNTFSPNSTAVSSIISNAALFTISGGFQYIDVDDNTIKPIRYATVRLYDASTNTVLASSWTDSNGYYSFPNQNFDGVKTLYVNVFSETAAAKVVTPTNVEYSFGSGPIYISSTSTSMGWYLVSDSSSWQIMDNIITEYQWIETRTGGWTRPQVTVKFPYGTWSQFTYSTCIPLIGCSESIWLPYMEPKWVVYHEYAHAVMFYARGNNMPSSSYPTPLSHSINTVSDGGFALTEGWAEFMASAVMGFALLDNTDCMGNKWDNTAGKFGTLEDNFWRLGETCNGGIANNDGGIVEGAVASYLWDIFDPLNDDGVYQDFNWAGGSIWDIMFTYKPNSIAEFRTYWNSKYYYGTEMAAISGKYIDGDYTPPPTPVPDDGISIISNDNTPTFTWAVPTDTSGIAGYYYKVDGGSENWMNRLAIPNGINTPLPSTTLSTQSDGTHTFYVRAKDNVGNIGSYGTHQFNIDTILPILSISSATNGQVFITPSIGVGGVATDNLGLNRIEVKLNSDNWLPTSTAGTNTQKSWTLIGTITLTSGSNIIYARATDAAGNTEVTSVTVTYTPPIDNIYPTVSFTYPDGQTVSTSSITASGTATDDTNLQQVAVRVNSGSWTNIPLSGTSAPWSLSLSLISGSNTIEARATDAVGNVGTIVARTVTYTTVGPVHNINKNINYTTIQSAIDNASPGDEIRVDSGIYPEQVNVYKRLTMRGIGMPVANAGGSGSAITLSADGIRLEGFTVTGSGSYPEAGIKVTSSNNAVISNNVSNNYYGIYLASSSNNTLIGNNVSNNGWGISMMYSSNNTLIGNNANTNNNGEGIELYQSHNNTLNGNNASNNEDGIYLDASHNNTLTGNNASKNYYNGIYLEASHNSTLINNIMTGNKYNFGLWDNEYLDSNQIDTSNLVDGKSVYYIIGASNRVYDSSTSVGIFYCINCINVTIKNVDINKNNYGIFFWNTSLSRIQNVNASNNNWGIYLYYSSNNTLSGNNANPNKLYGIELESSSNNTLSSNNASNNNYNGISLRYSSNNNTLIGNNASNNNYNGIYLEASSNNFLYSNNLVNNTINNASDDSSNQWDNGTIGNHYSNFDEPSEGCNDNDNNGICDSVYSVPGGSNIDRYPLTTKKQLTGTISGTVRRW